MPDPTLPDEPIIRKGPDGTLYPCHFPFEHWREHVCSCQALAWLKEHSEKARKRPGRKVSRFGRIMLALVFVVPWWVVGYVVVKSMDDAGWLWWAHSAWWWLRATVALLWAYLT